MTTSLVTGGAGFIGSHLCRNLLEKGHEVVCFDNMSTGSAQNISDLKSKKSFTLVKGDANTAELDAVFKKYRFEYVFHYAAVVGVKKTEENPVAVLSDVKGIMRILELSRKHDVKKAVFASSSEVYGHPLELPEREDGAINPHIPYAAVKLLGENWFTSYHSQYGLPTTSLRLFNVYGPMQRDTPYGFVVGIFTKQALGDESPSVFGDGRQTRDFTFIEDNVEATMRCLGNKRSDGQVINIGTGKETRIIDLANKIIRACGKEKTLKPRLVPARKLEITRRCASVDRMKDLLGFTPQYTLNEGLGRTVQWYRTN